MIPLLPGKNHAKTNIFSSLCLFRSANDSRVFRIESEVGWESVFHRTVSSEEDFDGQKEDILDMIDSKVVELKRRKTNSKRHSPTERVFTT